MGRTAANNTLAAARAYLRAGLSLIPVKRDGSKAPDLWTWKGYTEHLPLTDEVDEWFDCADPPGIGIIGGKVSGNLECLDFDAEAEAIFPAWCELVQAEAPGLVEKLSVVQTPRPGFHVRYRCAEVPIPGNTKLAMSETGEVLIETRGEGGYALAPGSPAECHASGRPYVHHSGQKLSRVRTITAAEREVLVRCARSFDRQSRQAGDGTAFRGRASDGYAVSEDFDRRASWADVLEPHGWCKVRSIGGKTYWRRPGKDGDGWSATTGHCTGQDGADLLAVFSSNADPFEGPSAGKSCTCYGKFRAYALLNHRNDFKAAVKDLAAKGYGPQQERNGHAKAPASRGLVTVCLATVRPEPVRWLVEDYIPLGKNVLIAGDGGEGKTSIALHMTACLTTGRQCFGLDYAAPPPADVLLISCEDDAGDTIVPRLHAHGADVSRIHHVTGIKTKDGKPAPFSLAYFDALAEELESRPAIRLVIIDPAGAYVGRARVDDHKNAELQALLQPLAEVAAQRRVTVLLLTHVNKGSVTKAVHKVMGSAGYVNAVRAAFLVTPDPEDDARKLFLPLKFNLGPKPPGLAYRMQTLSTESAQVVLDLCAEHLEADDRARLARQLFRVQWEGPVPMTADQAVAEATCRERGPGKVDQAAEWLTGFLGSHAWPSKEVMAAGEKAGFTRDNLFQAKKKLGTIKAKKEPGKPDGDWLWGLGDPRMLPLRQRPDTSDTSDTSIQTSEKTPGKNGSVGSVGSVGSEEHTG